MVVGTYPLKLSIGVVLTGLCLHVGVIAADPLVHGEVPVDVCDSLRLPGKCKPAPLSTKDNMRKDKIPAKTLEFKKKMTLPPQEIKTTSGICEAHYRITYAQMNEQVKVETSIENKSCAASHGEYSLRIRTLSETGEAITRSFDSSWSRPDDQNVVLTNLYPMGNSRDLIWVKVRSRPKTSCFCD